MPIPPLLQALLEAPGPSGYETEPTRVFRETAQSFGEVTTDALGSSIARVRGTGGGPLLAVVGHIDEIGLIVTHVGDEGVVFVRGLGGWFPEVLRGQRVEILARGGRVPAVVGAKADRPPRRGEDRTVLGFDDLHLDVGARSREEAQELVRVGDPAVLAGPPVELRDGRLISRALDDRLGVYVALEAARRLAEEGGAPGDFAAVAAVGEEAGDYSGARTAAFALEPDVALVVDITSSTDLPGGESKTKGELKLGAGPAIARGLPISPWVADRLFDAADAERIPHVPEVYTGTTNTDLDAVHVSRAGVPTGLISIPIRYTHSPTELCDLADVEAAVRLVVAFARRLDRAG